MAMAPWVDGKSDVPRASNIPLTRCFSSSGTPVNNAKRTKPSNVKRSKPSNVKRAKPRYVPSHSPHNQRLYFHFPAKNPVTETRRLNRIILATLGPQRSRALPLAPDIDSYVVS